MLEKLGMSLKGKPGMSPKGNEECHHHSSGRCFPRSPSLFQQHILMDHPAPVALLAFWQGQGHVSHIPRNVLSQQRPFPFQWDYPDTMEGLSSLAPVLSPHCIFPWINLHVSHPALYQRVAMGCSVRSFFLDPKLSKHFLRTGRERGEAAIPTIINYKSILFSAWILPGIVVFFFGLAFTITNM